jgi:hypothetical protein
VSILEKRLLLSGMEEILAIKETPKTIDDR